MSRILRVSWYRLRATFARRWTSYLSLTLLIGLVGGLALASVAGARRTDSSFPIYWRSTDPATTQAFTAYDDPQFGQKTGFKPALNAKIARLPDVERTAVEVGFDGNVNLNGVRGLHPHFTAGETPPTIIGGSEFLTLDRVTLVSGHLFSARHPDEAVINEQAAVEIGVHVGSVIAIPFYSDAEATSSTYNGPPYLFPKVTIVGVVVFNSSVVQDEIDQLGSAVVLLSPKLTERLENCCAYYSGTAIKVRGGPANVARVHREIDRVDPIARFGVGQGSSPAATVAKAQQEIEPEAIALGVFGAIAGLAVLLIAGQMVGRIVRSGARDARTLRALGADLSMTVGSELFGPSLAVVSGALLAVALAICLSPLAPLGPVRPVYPDPGVSYDWTVLGFGFLALTLILLLTALIMARRELDRPASEIRREASSWVSRVLGASSLPLSLATGLRFALKSGRGPDAAPVRSATLGAVLAIVVLVSTLTFGASLNNLVSHPSLYGWNWNYAMLSGFAGEEDMPLPQVTRLFNRDPYVAAWSGANFATAELDGTPVPMMVEQPNSAVAPPVTSGHGLEAPNEIVLGKSTLAQLHKHVGQTVTFSNGRSKPSSLTIVGTATMTPISKGIEMGTGGLVAPSEFPTNLLNTQQNTVLGPNAVLIRLRAGVSTTKALESFRVIAHTINRDKGDSGSAGGVVAHLRPAEIANYRSMGTTPAILGGGLALGAVVALALTLTASVRRRRRELALLKSLGFVGRQLASAVAWQSSVAVGVGLIVGIPIGVVLGRTLWTLFADEIDAVPVASVPGVAIALIAVGSLLLANLVAVEPGRVAAHTPTALVLRDE
ncbi:MAG TPA: FtsX-like permease family protein [Acidimicrobiales bacterium]|nr:FtsX-like permease family protein [Acidimicrobiales bacterium]